MTQTEHDAHIFARKQILAFSAMGSLACALADMTHEILGHMAAAWLTGNQILSLSTVAIQSASPSRAVSAAGTIANLLVGGVSLIFVSRATMRADWRCFLWLFSAFNLLNSGYLVASALLGNGDWAAVIGDLSPAWAWRGALGIVGAAVYLACLRLLAQAIGGVIERKELDGAGLRRLVIAAYLAGGAVLTSASLFNPIGPELILMSGIGASFGLSAGLLFIPAIVGQRCSPDFEAGSAPPPGMTWFAVAGLVGILFVALFGPGIQVGGGSDLSDRSAGASRPRRRTAPNRRPKRSAARDDPSPARRDDARGSERSLA